MRPSNNSNIPSPQSSGGSSQQSQPQTGLTNLAPSTPQQPTQTLQSNNGNGPTTASQNQQGSVDCNDPNLLLGYGTPQLASYKANCKCVYSNSCNSAAQQEPQAGLTNPATPSSTSSVPQTDTGNQNQQSGSSSPPVTDLTPHRSSATPPSSTDCSSSTSPFEILWFLTFNGLLGCGTATNPNTGTTQTTNPGVSTTTTNPDGSITTTAPDGKSTTKCPDGYEIDPSAYWTTGIHMNCFTVKPDGVYVFDPFTRYTYINDKDHRLTTIDSNGHWYINFPEKRDGSWSTYYENGTTITKYPDGRTITH